MCKTSCCEDYWGLFKSVQIPISQSSDLSDCRVEWPRFAVLYKLDCKRRCSGEVLNTVQNLMLKHVEAGWWQLWQGDIGDTQLRQVENAHETWSRFLMVYLSYILLSLLSLPTQAVLRKQNADSTMTRNSRLSTMLSDGGMHRSQKLYLQESGNMVIFWLGQLGQVGPIHTLLLV